MILRAAKIGTDLSIQASVTRKKRSAIQDHSTNLFKSIVPMVVIMGKVCPGLRLRFIQVTLAIGLPWRVQTCFGKPEHTSHFKP